MGNTRSSHFEQYMPDLWWVNKETASIQNNDAAHSAFEFKEEVIDKCASTAVPEQSEAGRKLNPEKMADIKKEISIVHEKRLRILSEKKKEIDNIRQELETLRNENSNLKERLVLQDDSSATHDINLGKLAQLGPLLDNKENTQVNNSALTEEFVNFESILQENQVLQKSLVETRKELRSANLEITAFETERNEYSTHVTALKDIIHVSKQLLKMRENQITELTTKVSEIETSLAEKEVTVHADDLRKEYDKQLLNIKHLRNLYEERQKVAKVERDKLIAEFEEVKINFSFEQTKNNESQERILELENDNSKKYDEIRSLESNLGLSKAECRELRAELNIINQLFSQILLSFNSGQEVNLDKLVNLLQENHDLLTDIVINEDSNEIASALPKVLLDLINQVNEKCNGSNETEETTFQDNKGLETISEESESQTSTQQNSLNSAAEIVQNLPKVWRVLSELLSHQTVPVNILTEEIDKHENDSNPCYNSIDTPTGPRLVLSVSKTFIRLKDLILEKKGLEKETGHLKQLNTHLETRLQDQEKRLEMVSQELSKTWHVVGKMQKQHQQLHTQEKILRYELAQKRKMLTELKEELEYCREKWIQAREKNVTTEAQWKQLRMEFSSRKAIINDDLNNSGESGYSDEKESDDDQEQESESPTDILSDVNPDQASQCSIEMAEVNLHSNEHTSDYQPESFTADTIAHIESPSPGHSASDENASNSTILEVIQDEISKIETSPANSEQKFAEIDLERESSCISPYIYNDTRESTNAMVHSMEHNPVKTDSVQILETELQSIISKEPCIPDRPKNEASYTETIPVLCDNSSERKGSMCNKISDEVYKVLQNDVLQTINRIQHPESSQACTMNTLATVPTNKMADEIFQAREERLKRLEKEAEELVVKTSNTSHRSNAICTKLDNLHEQYGERVCRSNIIEHTEELIQNSDGDSTSSDDRTESSLHSSENKDTSETA